MVTPSTFKAPTSAFIDSVDDSLPVHTQAERYLVTAGHGDHKALASAYHLAVTEHGSAKNTLSNILVALEQSDAWKPHVWYDAFLDRVLIRDGQVREWADHDSAEAAAFLQRYLAMDKIQPAQVQTAVATYCRRSARQHCLRDWLRGLTWDQVPRMDTAFEDYWGVKIDAEMPCEYVRTASKNFFLGMVARVFRPGCQLDTMPVFEGSQGRGKSSALRLLGGEYYAQQSDSVTNKDFFQTLAGKWLIEIGELDAFSRAEVTRVKTVISTPVDRYRPSYGRVSIDHPRQCVFCGTTNKDDWGNDETGLRRFWPVRVGEINLTTLKAARDQLFAEAVVRFGQDESWWTMPLVETLGVQADRQQELAWTDLILPSIGFLAETTLADVLMRTLKVEPGQITRPMELTVARVLRTAGWEKKVRTVEGGKSRKVWVNPDYAA